MIPGISRVAHEKLGNSDFGPDNHRRGDPRLSHPELGETSGEDVSEGCFTKHEGRAAPSRLCVDTHACARASRECDRRTSPLTGEITHAASAAFSRTALRPEDSYRRSFRFAFRCLSIGRLSVSPYASRIGYLAHTPRATERRRLPLCSPINYGAGPVA